MESSDSREAKTQIHCQRLITELKWEVGSRPHSSEVCVHHVSLAVVPHIEEGVIWIQEMLGIIPKAISSHQ